jgi:hypothetical protein
MSVQSERARAGTSPKIRLCSLFLLEGGISGQSIKNKKYAKYKFIQPNFFLAKSEVRAHEPENVRMGLVFHRRCISG